MSNTVGAIDISSMPELLDLVEEVAETKKPKTLTRGNKAIGVLMPVHGEREEIPNERAIALMKEAEEDFKVGRKLSFKSGKDALAYLDNEIAHEKQRAGH
jgi:hypothetical protein